MNAFSSVAVETLETRLHETCAAIKPLGHDLDMAGQSRLDNLTKPQGSLGQLESIALRLYKIGNGFFPLRVDPAMMFTIAGDHGVARHGVSPVHQDVTRQMLTNFLNGGAGVNVLCRNAHMDFMAVDAGVAGPAFAPHPRLLRSRIASGTQDFSEGPAMTRKEALSALALGIELVQSHAARGYRCFGAGEMGIGNTTSSSALYCAFLGLAPEDSVGVGAGLSPERLKHKADVITRGLVANAKTLQAGDPLEIMAALGGLEILTMAGVYLGAASLRLPVLVDGFIAGAAFLCSRKLAWAVGDYCFFAHCSAEKAHRQVLESIGQKAMLDLGMRLGEGTGAALGLNILRAAADIFNDMASFESAGVKMNG